MKATLKQEEANIWVNYRDRQIARVLGYTPWVTIPFLFLNAVFVFMDQFVRRLPILSYLRIIPCMLAIWVLISWYRKMPVRQLFTLHQVWLVSTLLMFYGFAIVSYPVGLLQSSVNALMICVFGMVIIGTFETRTLILLYTVPLLVFVLVIYISGMADGQLAHMGNAVALMLVCVATNEVRERFTLNEFKLSRQLEDALAQLKSTQAQLIQREKLASLGELTAGIAHEILNPLNFVNNFSELNVELIDELTQELGKESVDVPYSQEIVNNLNQNQQKIQHHGKRAENIVRNMLEHSRLVPGEPQPTNLNKLVDEYIRFAHKNLEAKEQLVKVQLVTSFADTIGEVMISPQETSRVLLNLFTNAFYAVVQRQKQVDKNGKLADYQPTVKVSTARTTDQVAIVIKDNGTGIPESIKSKIFQPFFTTKPTGEGIGLGLSLSYDIITNLHGGTLTMESTEGEGATFTILLPNE